MRNTRVLQAVDVKDLHAKRKAQELANAVIPNGGNFLPALKWQCESTGAAYALYWVAGSHGFDVAAYYEAPQHLHKTNADRGDDDSFAKRCHAVHLDNHTLISMVASSRRPAFVTDTNGEYRSNRARWFAEFGIKSVFIVPFADGVLEYGSDESWQNPPLENCQEPSPTMSLRDEYLNCMSNSKREGLDVVNSDLAPFRQQYEEQMARERQDPAATVVDSELAPFLQKFEEHMARGRQDSVATEHEHVDMASEDEQPNRSGFHVTIRAFSAFVEGRYDNAFRQGEHDDVAIQETIPLTRTLERYWNTSQTRFSDDGEAAEGEPPKPRPTGLQQVLINVEQEDSGWF